MSGHRSVGAKEVQRARRRRSGRPARSAARPLSEVVARAAGRSPGPPDARQAPPDARQAPAPHRSHIEPEDSQLTSSKIFEHNADFPQAALVMREP